MATIEINSKKKLTEWIKRRLGWPTIEVEIDENSIEYNIEDAIQMFSRHSGDVSYQSALVLAISAGEEVYTIEDDNIESVLRLEPQSDMTNGINVLFSPTNQLYNRGELDSIIWGTGGGSGLVDYELGLQYLEQMRNSLYSEFFLRFDKYNRTLTVSPKPEQDIMAVLEVFSKYDPGTAASAIYDEYFVKEYSLALTKILLGRIYGKFSMTLPGGGTINADTYLSEGLEEKEKLEEWLLTHEAEPLDFIVA